MRIKRRKITAMQGLEISPVTANGEIVYSTIEEESDPNNPTDRWVLEITPESDDAIKVLKFLDEQNGIGWTPRLKRAEKELREALHDMMSAK